MPGGDRTGPVGRGPMSGRGLGYCAGYDSPGFTKGAPRGRGYDFGRGFGRGWGRGLGRGRGYWWRGSYPYYEPDPYSPRTNAEPSKEEEKNHLENIIKGLEEEIKAIKDRIKELSKGEKEGSQ